MSTLILLQNELAQVKEENGRLRQLSIDIFAELETSQEKIVTVETAVVNSDISTERNIVELSLMLTDTMKRIADELPDEITMN